MTKYRWLPVLGLVMVLVITMFVVPVAATSGVTVNVNAPAEVAVGDSFTIRLDITNVESFVVSEFVVTFDSTILTLTDITDGEISGNTITVDGYTASWAGDPGKVKVLVSWPPLYPGVNGSGYLCQLHYNVIGTGEQTGFIDLSDGLIANEQGMPIEATWVGTILHVRASGATPASQPETPTSQPSSTEESATLKLDGFTTSMALTIDQNGRVPEAFQLKGAGENVRLDIAKLTKLVDAQGNALELLFVNEVANPPTPPVQMAVIGCYDFGPDGAKFDPAIILTIKYNPALLPAGTDEDTLYIAFWDGRNWIALESNVNAQANMISTYVNHFTQFAVISEATSPSPPGSTQETISTPATLSISSLLVTPHEVKSSEPVIVTALVKNTGGSRGTYTIVLKVNGAEEARKQINVTAGQSETVTFELLKDTVGTYTVSVDGKIEQFTVIAPGPTGPPEPTATSTKAPLAKLLEEWWFIGSIAGGCIVIILLVILLRRSRRLRYRL